MFKISLFLLSFFILGCHPENNKDDISAQNILGNPDYPAISFGGYRHKTRDIVPTVKELKDDMRILAAMGIKVLRTYNTSKYMHTSNLLRAIKELKEENSNFEMYVMLGAWIECEGAWSKSPNHRAGNLENNTAEIQAAIEMANTYSDIVKMIAVGNEAMVQWATNYFVYPNVILKWVNYLQKLKETGGLPSNIWITSSDNYESWGGGSKIYQTQKLVQLIRAVDFISLHTYPFHDTHYKPTFWCTPTEKEGLSTLKKTEEAMLRAKNYAIDQYQASLNYITSLGIEKPIHIGETGWATVSNSSYGQTGSRATDEYKEKLYYQHMREWTKNIGISCFYFEAFDERWKDQGNKFGSENHFGLINLKNEAKYALWESVDKGIFDGLTRNGLPITKTYNGDKNAMLKELFSPPLISEIGSLEITTTNETYTTGDPIKEKKYIITQESSNSKELSENTFPSAKIKLNSWEGTCGIKMNSDGIIKIHTGIGSWWGCALEIQTEGIGENLSKFTSGKLNFEIKGTTKSSFKLGFQKGLITQGDLSNHYVIFENDSEYDLYNTWTKFSIPIEKLLKESSLTNLTSLLFLQSVSDTDGGTIALRNISYSQ